MSAVYHPADGPPDAKPGGWRSLVRRRPNPSHLWFLGLLSLPGYFLDGFDPLKLFALCFLFAFWPAVAWLVPGLGRDMGTDPTDWIDFGGAGYRRRAAVSSVLLVFQPMVLVTSVRQVIGGITVGLRYRGDLPDPDSFEAGVQYRLPFDGEWTVVNGSPDRRYSHSWGIPGQRYAYDFLLTDDDGRTRRDEVSGPEDHYCFDEPVLAPADGEVVDANDDHRDYHRTDGWLDPLQRDVRGNYVTIQHAQSEYSVLAHLKAGSVAVEVGQEVSAGEVIGRCGHSGNSTEPHLHFQVQDRPNFYSAMGLPIRFDTVSRRFPEGRSEVTERGHIHAGQLVRHEPGQRVRHEPGQRVRHEPDQPVREESDQRVRPESGQSIRDDSEEAE